MCTHGKIMKPYVYKSYAYRELRKGIVWARNWFPLTNILYRSMSWPRESRPRSACWPPIVIGWGDPFYVHCMPLYVMNSVLWFVEWNPEYYIMCHECLLVTSIWIVQVYLYMWNVMQSDESIWFMKLKRKGNWFTALVPVCYMLASCTWP